MPMEVRAGTGGTFSVRKAVSLGSVLAFLALVASPANGQSFVNFETPHVSPIAMSPDGSTLAVCNTPDNRVELFDITSGTPESASAIAVGMDPVSCRFRTNTELWVVNHISDSVDIVDLPSGVVVRTLTAHTAFSDDIYLDEPCDVVFAGTPARAFVTFSQSNTVAVWDLADLDAAPQLIPILGEDPRAMAVSPDGNTVYVAIFESGNRTTIIGGGVDNTTTLSFPPNDALNDTENPYGGVNPPPNDGANFFPPKDPGNGTPPKVGLIVKQDNNGVWRDDNGTDWSAYVSGAKAPMSGRPVGWTLIDHDMARINANTLAVEYAGGLMNICMAIGVNPVSGAVTIVGTDATNEIRFEPKIGGIFLRVRMGIVDTGLGTSRIDLNAGHLDYAVRTLLPNLRKPSIGDPRGIVWNAAGDRGYITGMGSNNLITVDAAGTRIGALPIVLPEGPTGLVLDEARNRLYVVSKFAASVSVVDLGQSTVTSVPLYDPSPIAIKKGRKHLYNTQKNSGLGHIACASCHVDARIDRLAWDLGDPSGAIKNIDDDDFLQNLGMALPGLNVGFENWHPMKGPMTTQTMQDIIGHEPHHWRGDRDGLEEFALAFAGLQGSVALKTTEMQEFEDFLATITYPPNPYRNLNNSLRDGLPMGPLGQYKTGRFGNGGDPLPNGNATGGLSLFRNFNRPMGQGLFPCVMCHALPTGGGSNATFNGDFNNPVYTPIPKGADGEFHSTLSPLDGSTNKAIKVAQLRNVYDKAGSDFLHTESTAGFGVLHDGSVDSVARFLSSDGFSVVNDQEVANLTALVLQFSGSEFPPASAALEPPGIPSKDVHAAVGKEVTFTAPAEFTGTDAATLFAALLTIAKGSNRVDLVFHQPDGSGIVRGYLLKANSLTALSSDALGESSTVDALRNAVSPTRPLRVMAVPGGSGIRIALDRDLDGWYDHNERLAGTSSGTADTDGDGLTDLDEVQTYHTNPIKADSDGDGVSDGAEIQAGTDPLVDETPDPIAADVNGSGAVDAVDVQLVINAALGIDVGAAATDVNHDDNVNAVDVQLVINAALGLS